MKQVRGTCSRPRSWTNSVTQAALFTTEEMPSLSNGWTNNHFTRLRIERLDF